MKIVAFLQNQWFKNPEHVAQIYARHGIDFDQRARLDSRFLFHNCATGKRLAAIFRRDLCDKIVWSNASPKFGGISSAAFPADIEHMTAVMNHFKPDIVLGFGRIACDALIGQIHPDTIEVPYRAIYGPHPTARGASTIPELKRMADELRQTMQVCDAR